MATRTAQGHLTVTRQRNGTDGSDGTSVLAQYSADASSWHSSYSSGDIYMRTSSDNGSTWTDAIRIVGESGENGSYIDYAFAISAVTETASVTTAPTISGSWSDSPLSVTSAYPYLWCRMISVDSDGTEGTPRYIRLTGEKGDEGTTINIKGYVASESALPTSGLSEGDAYVTEDDGHLHVYTASGFVDVGQFVGDAGSPAYVHFAWANSEDGSEDFTTDDSDADGHAYMGTYTDNTESDSTDYKDYTWVKITGAQGASLVALTSSTTYSYSSSTWNDFATEGTVTTWKYVTNVSDISVGDIVMISGTINDLNNISIIYYGTVTAVDTTNNTVTTSAITYTTSGSDGVSVSSVDVEYAQSTSSTTAPTSGWSTDAPTWVSGRYVWSRTHIVYSDESEKYTSAVCISGSTGSTGNGISSIVEQYYQSTSSTALSGGSWSTDAPTWTDGTYIWTRSKITYTDGTTTYTTAICATGNTGTGIAQYVCEYYLSTSSSSLSGGSWSTDVPTWTDGKYIWVRYLITYTDGSSEYTSAWNTTGAKGETGDTGVSVTSITNYYVATTLQSGVTISNTSGWSTTFPSASADTPYIWRYQRTALSDGTYQNSSCELIAIYQCGANPNLLDDTSFASDYGLDAWDKQSAYVVQTGETVSDEEGVGVNSSGVQGLNSYYDIMSHYYDTVYYKDVLRQILWNPDGTTRKLDGGTYYTLSFWVKGYSSVVTINETSSAYGFARRYAYLTAGKTYTISVVGLVSEAALNDGMKLRTYVYNDDWSEEGYCDISSSSSTTATITFTPSTTGVYHITSYLYDNSSSSTTATATVTSYNITQTDFLTTLIYPSCVDTSYPVFFDGVSTSSPRTDCAKTWSLSSAWTQHTVTFRTKSTISSEIQYLLYRMQPALIEGQQLQVWICAPKLERGMIATGYVDSSTSLQGALLRATEWESGKEYLSGQIGEKYHDVVYYDDGVYECITSHISGDTTPDEDTENWKEGDQRELVATKVLLSNNALIKVLSSNQIVVYDEDGAITGGLQGNPSLPIFWAGAESPSSGMWQVGIDGFSLFGDPNAERIEINPNDKSIRFFDEDNNFVTEHNAKTIDSLDDILPQSGEITLLNSNTDTYITPSSTIWYGVTGTDKSYASEIWQQSGHGAATVVINAMQLSLTTAATSTNNDAHPTARLQVGIEMYSDADGSTLLTTLTLKTIVETSSCDGESHVSTISNASGSVHLQSGYYYRLTATLYYNGGGTSNVSTVSAYYNIASAVIASDAYSSQFFGNGIALAKTTSDYFAAMIQNSAMRFAMANANYGIDFNNDEGMLMKRGTMWHVQPITLLALKVVGSSSGVSVSANLTGITVNENSRTTSATEVAIARLDEGVYRIYFPTDWTSYGISTKGVAQATALLADNSTAKGYWARIGTISATYMDVITGDDASGEEGTFFVELKI